MRTTRRLVAAWVSAAGLLLGAAEAEATGALSGRLTNPAGEPLAGATVAAPALGRETTTDADGAWSLADLPAGPVELQFAMHVEHRAVETVTVVEGADTRVDRSFDWGPAFHETILVVSASRHEERITDAPAAITQIPAIEIERKAATAQLPKLLEFSPGVEVTQSGLYDYNLNTRGFNSSLNRRVATVIDGRDPSVPFLGAQEWASVSFPLDDIDRAEFVRGPSAALYGPNASSGVLNLITKRPKDSEGGLVRLTAGELETFNGDARWASRITGDWYGKILAGYRKSGDFTVSRNGFAEYSVPCGGTRTTDCLPQERVPLDPEDDDEISIASARVDRHYGDTSLLTLEGGWADISGPVFQTGIGRVQLVDVERRFGRINFSTPHWNVLGTVNNRDAQDQTALQTGNNVLLDEEAFRGEIQTNWAFRDDTVRLVAGLSHEDKEIDSSDDRARVRPRLFGRDPNQVKRLRQTLLFEPVSADSTALFAQLDWELSPRVQLVVAGRYDDSTLHEPQYSPKAALVFQLTDTSSIRVSYNESFQVPNYSEFFLQAEVLPAINFGRLPCQPGSTLGGVPCGDTGFINLEEVCALDGVVCGWDTDFEFGEVPGTDPTADTQILALGNSNLEVEEVKTYEIGYTGLLGDRVSLSLDYYQSENENFITDLLPQLGTPLGRINPEFGAYQLPPGLTAEHQQWILNVLGLVLGQLRPFLSQNFDRTPIVAVRSYTNFGAVDTQGADLGLEWYVTPQWTFSASYSWFDFDIQDSAPGLDQILLPNSPENKYSVGIAFANDRFDASVGYRWSDEFRWVVGPFQGQVPSYGTADVVANFHLNEHFSLGINVANALDDEHWEAFGGDLLGRRALGSVTFRW